MVWRVVVRGQTYETNLEELKQWVREGRVLPTDQVFQPEIGWRAAAQVPELQGWFPPGSFPAMPGSGFSGTPYASPYDLPPTVTSYAPQLSPFNPYVPVYGQVGSYSPPSVTLFPGVPASLGKRFVGFLVDSLLSGVCALPGFLLYISAVVAGKQGGEGVPTWQAFGGYALMYFGAIGYLLLCAYMTSTSGASPGKKVAGVVVLRKDGQYLSFGMAVLREFLRNLFSNICFLLNLWLLFDPERQQLYDKVVGANVYDAGSERGNRVP